VVVVYGEHEPHPLEPFGGLRPDADRSVGTLPGAGALDADARGDGRVQQPVTEGARSVAGATGRESQ